MSVEKYVELSINTISFCDTNCSLVSMLLFLRLKESNKLKMVINHPVYESDPLAAIYQHLQMTQPATDKKPKRKDGKTRKSKSKKKKSKSPVSMEL